MNLLAWYGMVIPDFLVTRDPNLANSIIKITLPVEDVPDRLNWHHAIDGVMTSKLAYTFLDGTGNKIPWHKLVWNVYTPPTRSFIAWTWIHDKLPTDDNLRKRGCFVLSMCCFCNKHAESSNHIFLSCPVTFQLWDWIMKGTGMNLDCSSCLTLLLDRVGVGSKMVQQVLNSVVLHTIWSIWLEGNEWYFNGVNRSMASFFNVILAEVKLSFNLAIVKGSSAMLDYKVAKLFNIPLQIKKVNISQNVSWKPPPDGVIKINCDGSSIGTHPCGSIGFVLRDSSSNFLDAMSSNIGNASPIKTELIAFMRAIEKAIDMNLTNILMETDSVDVVNAFDKVSGVSWQMLSRWLNCKQFCMKINCRCTHILREGNMAADAMAKNGQGLACIPPAGGPPLPLLFLLFF